MSLLTVSGLTKHFGAELIFEDVSFQIEPGDHVALIGSNGAGKSTILRIIAGLEKADAGGVSRSRNLHVAYLPQDPQFDSSHTLYEALLETFAETISAQEELRKLEAVMADGHAPPEVVEEYGRLQAVVEHTGYDYPARIERVLTGLGFSEESWYTPVHQLSGGQLTRASLARTLLKEADLLLLDEPTNHLDIPAVEWLEGYLRDLKQAFLIVAHDRYLLDRVTKRTLELSFHHVTSYDAAYSKFLELKAERVERQRLEYEAQQQHIAKTEDFIRRYRAGQRSKEARGREKRLNRLERVERPREEDAVNLKLKGPERSGDIVLEAKGVVAGYEGKRLVRMPNEVVIRRGDKIALIGPNGAGKTTLLHTLLGSQPPLAGSVRWGAKTSTAYYSQSLEQLDMERTVLEEIQQIKPMGEEEGRNYLGRFLFSGDDTFKQVRLLSGGERSRVALARLILKDPNVLILDEPTNHLDIASRDALRDVLDEFSGTLLFVSHDRYLIDALAQQLWVLADARIIRYAGGYSQYARGQANALDASTNVIPAAKHESSEDRVRRLETEAEALAERLAPAATTIPIGQLAEMTERYDGVLTQLQEAQREWVREARDRLRSSSGSPARSPAARRR